MYMLYCLSETDSNVFKMIMQLHLVRYAYRFESLLVFPDILVNKMLTKPIKVDKYSTKNNYLNLLFFLVSVVL